MTDVKTVEIEYHALLREQRGVVAESYATAADSVGDLYQELQAKYGLSVQMDMMRVAVNDEFCLWTYKLSSGDRIVFIPPVAGG